MVHHMAQNTILNGRKNSATLEQNQLDAPLTYARCEMSTTKKQYSLTKYVLISDEGKSSTDSTESMETF